MTYIDQMRGLGPQASWQVTPTAEHHKLIAEAEGHETFDQPGDASPQGHQMQDHGGPKIGSPKLFILWASGQSSYDKSQFQAFAKDLMESGYFDKIAPYTGGSFTGRYLGAVDGPATAATFSPDNAVAYVKAAIAAGIAPAADGATVYSIMLPPGVTATLDNDSSCQMFCAYHSSDGGSILFTVQPDTSCGPCHGNQTPFEAACMVESHEVAELCSDPYGSGWYENATGEEDGDLVAWIPLQYGPWTVQGYFGNENGGSNLVGSYHPQQQPGPPPGTDVKAKADAALAGCIASLASAAQTAKYKYQRQAYAEGVQFVTWAKGQMDEAIA